MLNKTDTSCFVFHLRSSPLSISFLNEIHHNVNQNAYICLYSFDQDGTRTSVVEYFKKQYNCSLKYINWPCLQAGSDSSRPTYLPVEVVSFCMTYP
jgi:hypothetical protein